MSTSSVIGVIEEDVDKEAEGRLGWSFLKIIIGSPFAPIFDHSFLAQLVGSFIVLLSLIELPHLPSTIWSPSKGWRGRILSFSLKVFPNFNSGRLGLTFLAKPAWISSKDLFWDSIVGLM